MPKMPRKHTAYTADDLKHWNAVMTARQPGPWRDGDTFSAVESFSMGGQANGLALRIVNAYGETQNLMLNPAVAFALRAAILQAGQFGHWMDAQGNIIPPTIHQG